MKKALAFGLAGIVIASIAVAGINTDGVTLSADGVGNDAVVRQSQVDAKDTAAVANRTTFEDSTNIVNNVAPQTIEDLSDTDISGGGSDEYLFYTGTVWTNQPQAAIRDYVQNETGLDNLNDVDAQSGADEYFKHNGTSWTNISLGDARTEIVGGANLETLADVETSAAGDGDYLYQDASGNWTNRGEAAVIAAVQAGTGLGDLNGVEIDTPTAGQSLKYDGTAWTNLPTTTVISSGGYATFEANVNIGDFRIGLSGVGDATALVIEYASATNATGDITAWSEAGRFTR